MGRQESGNDHFTNGCSKERSHEDAYIVYGSKTHHTTDPHIQQLNHHQQHDLYHVPLPQAPPYVPDQIASNINLAQKPHHLDNIHNLTFPRGILKFSKVHRKDLVKITKNSTIVWKNMRVLVNILIPRIVDIMFADLCLRLHKIEHFGFSIRYFLSDPVAPIHLGILMRSEIYG